MKSSVFLTRALPEAVMIRLAKLFDLKCNREDRALTKEEIIRRMHGRKALISMLSDPVDAEVVRSNPHLRIIANYAVGYNNIDLQAAHSQRIVVTNTPGVLTEATADLTWSLILSLARRIPEGDRMIRSQAWSGWAPTQLLGTDLSGKKLGIIGLGRIGMTVAARAHGFGMRVIYHTRRRLPGNREKSLSVTYCSLARLLAVSDIVSLHVPLLPHTFHLIDRAALNRMKKGALLINTSRGAIVDEAALVNALKKRLIAGAGLDVYEREPKVHNGLLKLPNVVMLPHLGSATVETRIKMGMMVIDNIQAVLKGRKAPNEVKVY